MFYINKAHGISLQRLLAWLTRDAAPCGSIHLHVGLQDLLEHEFFRVRSDGRFRGLLVRGLMTHRQIINNYLKNPEKL